MLFIIIIIITVLLPCTCMVVKETRNWHIMPLNNATLLRIFIYLFYLNHTHNNGIHFHKLYKQ